MASEKEEVSGKKDVSIAIPVFSDGTDASKEAVERDSLLADAEKPGREETSEKDQSCPEEKEVLPDYELADKIMAFNNGALEKFQTEWRNPAEDFYNLAHIYLRVFTLPSEFNLPGRKRNDLIPASGIFSPEEDEKLFKAMDKMDKALASSLTHYGQLKKYVLDPSIQDNGRNGKKIAAMLEQDFKAFQNAANVWLEITKRKVRGAEQTLLAGHPLKRQALAGSEIMGIIEQVSRDIKLSELERARLADLDLKLNALIEEGGRPPFPAAPQLERLYRSFLKNASIYEHVLKRAALEGMFDIQRRELAIAGRACSDSYNLFVKAFNEVR